MATVLEGFLVSLGFDIDKDELAKFNTTVAEAGRRFMSIGKAAVGAGVAIGAAFAYSADSMTYATLANSHSSPLGASLSSYINPPRS